MEGEHDHRQLKNNPLFLISIAMIIAIIMTAISLLSYYNSETRRTVEQIQQNNLSPVVQTDESVPRELNNEYVDYLEKQITDKVDSLSTETDYNPDELTDSALGL